MYGKHCFNKVRCADRALWARDSACANLQIIENNIFTRLSCVYPSITQPRMKIIKKKLNKTRFTPTISELLKEDYGFNKKIAHLIRSFHNRVTSSTNTIHLIKNYSLVSHSNLPFSGAIFPPNSTIGPFSVQPLPAFPWEGHERGSSRMVIFLSFGPTCETEK